MDIQNSYEFETYVCTKETLKNTIDKYVVAIFQIYQMKMNVIKW